MTPPSCLRALASAVTAAGGRGLTLERTWPNWECWIHHGMDPAPYLAEVRAELGSRTRRHEVYAAPEGIFAVQDQDREQGLRLVTDADLDTTDEADKLPVMVAVYRQKTDQELEAETAAATAKAAPDAM